MENYTFRLRPGHDLFDSIEAFVRERDIQAGCVLGVVGSLTCATLRLANRETETFFEGHFEVVSLTGLVWIHGSHLPISISDEDGRTFGGHRMGSGCKIYTTAEIVILAFENEVYQREFAEDSGYDELAAGTGSPRPC